MTGLNEDKQDKEKDFYKTSKFDVLLIAFVLFLCTVSILGVFHKQISSQPGVAYIYQENRLLKKIGLEKEQKVILLNGKMELEVKAGRIRVLKSDCPHHICMNTGWIEYTGQSIMCVPNKMVIEIKSERPSLTDAVVGINSLQ